MQDTPTPPPPGRQPRLSVRAQLAIVGVLAIAVALAIGLGRLSGRGVLAAAAPAAGRPDPGGFRPTPEQWAGLQKEAVRAVGFRTELVTDGSIAVNEDATTPVFSPYSGRVTRVLAKPGDFVRKGSPLMAVEASEFVQGRNDLTAGVAALNTARAQLKLAQATEARQHEMYLSKSGALKDWLQSQSDLNAAQGALQTAEIGLASARNRLRILGKSDREIAALEASDPDGEIGAEALVPAPIAGTVTQRQVGLGQYITSAATGASNPVFTIGDLSTVWLVANVRETDAPLLRVGQQVEVRVLALPDRVFTAWLAWVAPAIDVNTHRLPVRAEVPNPGGVLKPMMQASFSIVAGPAASAPGVAQSAIVYDGDQARVWVARDDGSLAARTIRTGRTSAGMVEVLEGLQPGETVITGGTLFIDRAAQGAAQ